MYAMLINQILPEIKVSFKPVSSITDRPIIHSSQDAYELLLQIWDMDTIHLFEEFIALFLDRKNGVIGYRLMNRGNNCGTVVDVKLIFSIALNCNSSSIILAHNHPSGNTKPSRPDDEITMKIDKGANLFELKLLDHIVITPDSYYSYMDEGRISSP